MCNSGCQTRFYLLRRFFQQLQQLLGIQRLPWAQRVSGVKRRQLHAAKLPPWLERDSGCRPASLVMPGGLVVLFLLLLSLRGMKISPHGVCKDSDVFNASVAFFDSMINLCIPFQHDSSLFFSLDGATLYAIRTQSPGRLQSLLVTQVAMSWSRLGGERPEVR